MSWSEEEDSEYNLFPPWSNSEIQILFNSILTLMQFEECIFRGRGHACKMQII